ncbi:tautomerase family protein [Cupriavidus sp. WS]|uniref:tautomerase family protein n=1 Tax=Cupriavidus sp. WS TaxID=1312922 RepID=UPI0009DBDC9C|nr:tautomerase family protein [Cupriavidus sp. WS]
MPIIQISLVAGRPEEDVQHCIREVARTVSRTLHAPLSSVRVMVNEVPPTRFAVGDTLKSEPPVPAIPQT